MDDRNWSDIAYNFMVCPHGYTFEGRGINITNGANGTNSGNRSSHAVMCLGGEDNPFGESEKIEFRECIIYISSQTLAPNTCKGHRDHKLTACPGDERYSWVHQGMPVSTNPVPVPDPVSEFEFQEDTMFVFQDGDKTLWVCTSLTFDLLTGPESASLGHWVQAKVVSNAERDIILERIRKNRKRSGLSQQAPITWTHNGVNYSF
jgi:hypothetical protein